MSDNNLDLLTMRAKGGQPRLGERRGDHAEANADEEECNAFGFLRGLHDQAPSIEFRFGTGNRLAFPYSWLGPAAYNPSAGILLTFCGDLTYAVLIEGSNLNVLENGAVSLYDR